MQYQVRQPRPADQDKPARGRLVRLDNVTTRLQAMQRQINAKHFAVFRMMGNGLPASRTLTCIMENWGTSALTNANAIVASYGAEMQAHLERSTLPVVWDGGGEHHAIDVQEFDRFTRRMKPGLLPFSGIGFPTRLGAQGNGYVVFVGGYMDLSGDSVVDLHGRSCQAMADILANDEKRNASAGALGERELACLQMAGDGHISDEIAVKMGLSVHTVNAYLGAATVKLDSVNRIQAIAKAIRLGYIT